MTKIRIDYTKLIDSAHFDPKGTLFKFDTELTNNLTQDIFNGNPTCYLVSGYRGAGKSSFIKRIESIINERQKSISSGGKKEKEKEIVFVPVNFSKYQSQTFLLRKLIRGLYLNVSQTKTYDELKNNENSKKENGIAHLLDSLYEKTFYEVTSNNSQKDNKESKIAQDIDVVKLSAAIAVLLVFVSNLIFEFVSNTELVSF